MSAVRHTLHAIIPVLNEAENIPELLTGLVAIRDAFVDRVHVAVILVDDGSTDGTPSVARGFSDRLDLTVLSHDVKRGPGEAFGTAFEYLGQRVGREDWIVTMEGDNTSRPDLIERMMTRSQEGYDVVLASPYMYGGGVNATSTVRVILSRGANIFVKEFLGLNGIITVSSFFRLYRGSVLLELQRTYGPKVIERAGFECMIELLLKMVCLGITISEVPMVLDSSRRRGKSKMKLTRTVLGYLAIWRGLHRWKLEPRKSG